MEGLDFWVDILKKCFPKNFDICYSGRSKSNEVNYIHINFENESSFKSLSNHNFDYIFILAADLSGLGKNDIRKEYLESNITNYGGFLNFLAIHQTCKKIVYIFFDDRIRCR